MEGERMRIKVRDINEYLTCSLCNGYLIDATTIVECLHSFCRTCIVHYLHTSNYCPRCECVVHKKFPHQNIRSDRLLQDIVYKIVPGLFKEELRRRQEYFIKNNHPKDDWEQVSRQSRRRFFSQDDKISLCLEFSPRKLQEEVVNKRHSLKEENRRYLLCPAKLTVRLLKKFLQNKFSLDSTMKIDMWCSSESLEDEYTLIDVAYVIRWKRKRPMKINYSIYENRPAKAQNEAVRTFANSPANDSGIEDESPSFELSSEDPIIFADPDDVNWKEYEKETTIAETSDGSMKEDIINGNAENHCQSTLTVETKMDNDKESKELEDTMPTCMEVVNFSEPIESKLVSVAVEGEIEGVNVEQDTDVAVKDSCSVFSQGQEENKSENETDVSCSNIDKDIETTKSPVSKQDQSEILKEKTIEESKNESCENEHKNCTSEESFDECDRQSVNPSPNVSPLVIDTKCEFVNNEESCTDKEESKMSVDSSEQTAENEATQGGKNEAREEKSNATVDKSEQTELEDEDTDIGPSFNDSGAQTSPYYEEDLDEPEDIWNEGAIDLSKPKMIVIEPLRDNLDENKETNKNNSENLPTNVAYLGYCQNIPNIKIEEASRCVEDEIEDVQEYNYVADGIEEIEETRAFHHEEYNRLNHDLNEHSYSMMPNLEPQERHSKIILKQSTGKSMITIPGSYHDTSIKRAISPMTTLSKPSMCSEIIIPSPSKLITTFKSPRQAPISKRKRKHENKSNNSKVDKSVCKKMRKCTNVCNGHSVPQRSEKLVVKLSKSRNSNSYTATMT